MTVIKEWNPLTSQWETIVVGKQGDTGPGVASGGTAGQVLAKASSTNFDTEWVTPFMWPYALTSFPAGTYVTHGSSANLNFGGANTGTFIMPFLLRSTMTFDRIACDLLSAGGAGATVHLGIYNTDGVTPTSLIYGSPVGIPANTTGVKEDTINVTLQPGLYGLAVRRSEALNLRGFQLERSLVIGHSSNGQPNVYWLDNTFPFPDPANGTPGQFNGCPAVFLRVA